MLSVEKCNYTESKAISRVEQWWGRVVFIWGNTQQRSHCTGQVYILIKWFLVRYSKKLMPLKNGFTKKDGLEGVRWSIVLKYRK